MMDAIFAGVDSPDESKNDRQTRSNTRRTNKAVTGEVAQRKSNRTQKKNWHTPVIEVENETNDAANEMEDEADGDSLTVTSESRGRRTRSQDSDGQAIGTIFIKNDPESDAASALASMTTVSQCTKVSKETQCTQTDPIVDELPSPPPTEPAVVISMECRPADIETLNFGVATVISPSKTRDINLSDDCVPLDLSSQRSPVDLSNKRKRVHVEDNNEEPLDLTTNESALVTSAKKTLFSKREASTAAKRGRPKKGKVIDKSVITVQAEVHANPFEFDEEQDDNVVEDAVMGDINGNIVIPSRQKKKKAGGKKTQKPKKKVEKSPKKKTPVFPKPPVKNTKKRGPDTIVSNTKQPPQNQTSRILSAGLQVATNLPSSMTPEIRGSKRKQINETTCKTPTKNQQKRNTPISVRTNRRQAKLPNNNVDTDSEDDNCDEGPDHSTVEETAHVPEQTKQMKTAVKRLKLRELTLPLSDKSTNARSSDKGIGTVHQNTTSASSSSTISPQCQVTTSTTSTIANTTEPEASNETSEPQAPVHRSTMFSGGADTSEPVQSRITESSQNEKRAPCLPVIQPQSHSSSTPSRLIGGTQKRQVPEENSTSFKCKVCQRSLSNATALRRHLSTHAAGDALIFCRKCGVFVETEKMLEEHMDIHKLTHQCETCHRVFKNASTLEMHESSHSIARPYVCDMCDRSYKNMKGLNDHKRYGHAPKGAKLLCHICNQPYKNLSSLREHLARCKLGEERPHKCPQCPASFKSKSSCCAHMRYVHRKEKTHVCTTCGATFATKSIVESHMLTHTGERPFKCDDCGKQFTKKSTLARHLRSHTGEKPYHCTVCNKRFHRLFVLTEHKRIHTGDKPYKCTLCGDSFRQLMRFRRHERIHTGERPYKCDQCGKNFIDKNCLTSHLKTHSSERPYKCEECGMGFKWSASLRTHMTIHTGERPYSCDKCHRTFRQMQSLRAHRRIHTGERPYKCDVCSQRFRDSSTYYQHRRSHKEGDIIWYSCADCDKKFRKKDALRRHIRFMHDSIDGFACDACDETFRSKQLLAAHAKLHAGEMPYACAKCGQRFRHKVPFEKHSSRCAVTPLRQSVNEVHPQVVEQTASNT